MSSLTPCKLLIAFAAIAVAQGPITLDAVRGRTSLTTTSVIPRVALSGKLGPSKLSCTGSPVTCTLYDDTATTGSTTLVVRAGPGQGTADLQQWKNSAGATLSFVDSVGGISTPYVVFGAGEAKWASGTEGTCDASNRGRVVMVQGGAGVADTFRICSKDAAGAYAWRALF